MKNKIWFLLILFLAGCNEDQKAMNDMDAFMDEHGAYIKKEQEHLLDGPFKEAKLKSLTEIAVKRPDGSKVTLKLRGISIPASISTNKYEISGMKTYMLYSYLAPIRSTINSTNNNTISAIVCSSKAHVCIGKDPKTQELLYDVLTWEVIQMNMLITGTALVDRTDTDHSYYQAFLGAEALGRKYKQGYWATHTELPAQIITTGVSP